MSTQMTPEQAATVRRLLPKGHGGWAYMALDSLSAFVSRVGDCNEVYVDRVGRVHRSVWPWPRQMFVMLPRDFVEVTP